MKHEPENFLIRRACRADLPRLTEIYNQAIANGGCTGDLELQTVEDRSGWFEEHADSNYPILVYETDGLVAGYGYLSPYRPGRAALRRVAEVSYFLDFACHGQGIGTALLGELIRQAGGLGYKHLLAIVLDCNSGSLALLQKHGFEFWGRLPDLVELRDRTVSHLYYGLHL